MSFFQVAQHLSPITMLGKFSTWIWVGDRAYLPWQSWKIWYSLHSFPDTFSVDMRSRPHRVHSLVHCSKINFQEHQGAAVLVVANSVQCHGCWGHKLQLLVLRRGDRLSSLIFWQYFGCSWLWRLQSCLFNLSSNSVRYPIFWFIVVAIKLLSPHCCSFYF